MATLILEIRIENDQATWWSCLGTYWNLTIKPRMFMFTKIFMMWNVNKETWGNGDERTVADRNTTVEIGGDFMATKTI